MTPNPLYYPVDRPTDVVDLDERITRAIEDMVSLNYVQVDRRAGGSAETALRDLRAVLREAMTRPLEPLTPKERLERLIRHWSAEWGAIPHIEKMRADLEAMIVADREEVARYGSRP